jgi:hypothetical protein
LPNPTLHFLTLRIPALIIALAASTSIPASATDSTRTQAPNSQDNPKVRGFKTFLPRPGAPSEEPKGQIIQLLLDRKEKEGQDSYLVQVIFRGRPAVERTHRVYDDRVEIDFFDTGKPAMRPVRIRGGAVDASFLEELHYQDGKSVRRMVRLTLYTRVRPDMRFRNTLDRTLLLFNLPLEKASTPPASANSPSQPKSAIPAPPKPR